MKKDIKENIEMKQKTKNMNEDEIKIILKEIKQSIEQKPLYPPSLSNVLIIIFLFIFLIYLILKL